VAIIRGGTSRAVFVRAEDLPQNDAERDGVLLRSFAGDAGILADGMGGENPVLRKIAVVRPLPSGADGRPVLDYRFGQVNSALTSIDRTVECGNIASGVPLFGRLSGWCPAAADGEAWIHLANTGRRVLGQWSRWTDSGGDIRLTFTDVAPSTVAEALPGGDAAHELQVGGRTVRISLIRGLNPYVFIDAVGLGVADPASDPVSDEMYAILDEIDARARALWAGPVTLLKVCLVAPAQPGAVRARIVYVAERRVHRSIAVTGAATLALAGRIPGTVVYESLRAPAAAPGFSVRHPEGELPVGWSLRADGMPAQVSIDRSCRLILRGTAY
jgi:2-methylaconitate cis-trans-isomerase PrpF